MPQSIHYRAVDPVQLAAVLAEHWAEPVTDPLAVDVICLAGAGTRRWLRQTLSRRLGASGGFTGEVGRAGDFDSRPWLVEPADGVAAGLELTTVERLAAQVVTTVIPAAAAWSGEALQRSVRAALDASHGQSWFAAVDHYLGQPGERPGRRWHLARRVARLFERYQAWAPQLLPDWLEAGPEAVTGVATEPAVWQAGLAQAVADQLGLPPASQRAAVLEQIRQTDPLPQVGRLAIFCPDRLSPWASDIVQALASHHDLLWLTRQPLNHPVGRGLTELSQAVHVPATERLTVRQLPPPDRPPTLLGALQDCLTGQSDPVVDVRQPSDQPMMSSRSCVAGSATEEPMPVQVRPADGTIQFHASHGPDRQVDVLRDLLLGLLADDPTLQPRDILVLCPRLDLFSGWLRASFAANDDHLTWSHPAHGIRARLTGPGLTPANHFFALLDQVFALARSRATASQLLALCANSAVMTRFHFTSTDLERLTDLVTDSGLRWGLNAHQRAPFGVAEIAENTWSAGLNRLVLGVAYPPDSLATAGTALALESVTADSADLIGRLLELTGRLRRLVAALTEPGEAADWAERCRDIIDWLGAAEPDQAWQRTEVLDRLADFAAVDSGLMTLPDISAWLAEVVADRPSRDRWLAGDLTLAAPADMRLVPHRVICWLGLDHETFPRRTPTDGDDLLQNPGLASCDIADLEAGAVDRQALADSIMAARERLIIIYQGHDARNNAPLAPPGPVADLIGLTSQLADPATAHQLVEHYPAQAASWGPERSTFDATAVAAALATTRTRQFERFGKTEAGPGPSADTSTTETAMWEASSAPLEPIGLTLTDLARAVSQPAAHFLRWRAGLNPYQLALDQESANRPDSVPLELDGLGRWQLTNRLLRLARSGQDPAAIVAAEPLRGTLPPKALGQPLLQQAWAATGETLRRLAPYTDQPVVTAAIDLNWPGQPCLTGELTTFGSNLLTVQAGPPRPRGQMAAWIDLLALNVSRPDQPWRAVIIWPQGQIELTAGPVEQSEAQLLELISLWRRASRQPVPLPSSTALWAAQFWARNQSPDLAGLDRSWRDDWTKEPTWRLLWPQGADLWAEASASATGPRQAEATRAVCPADQSPRNGAAEPQVGGAKTTPLAIADDFPLTLQQSTTDQSDRLRQEFFDLSRRLYRPLIQAGARPPRLNWRSA
ncbi:MAG: exodeoxyribonuclease V subunit gamma [Propionibacteriaceae bacterium]|nr:exodeoxyribonuclease V subunit gamma [Propionibacteriaceae bacterium]